jgi:hypothetical protein
MVGWAPYFFAHEIRSDGRIMTGKYINGECYLRRMTGHTTVHGTLSSSTRSHRNSILSFGYLAGRGKHITRVQL